MKDKNEMTAGQGNKERRVRDRQESIELDHNESGEK